MERLNKYLAHAGLGSRRHCEELILGGHVTVDDVVVRELGTRVDPETSKVSVDGQPLSVERPVYWLLNKPRGYLCTNDDPGGRPRAIDLVDHIRQRVYTVGRLDEDSEGLLLLTNDGDLAHKLMHPRFGIEKTYLVQVAGLPTREQLDKLLDGVWMSDGHVKPKSVKRLKQQGESVWLEIVLSEGRNREIRRMLAGLGHKVMRLKRTALGTIQLGRLARGKSRPLTPPELTALRFAVRHATGAEDEASPPEDDRPHHSEFPPQPPRSQRPAGERAENTDQGEQRPARPPSRSERSGERRPAPRDADDRRGPARPREDRAEGAGARRGPRPVDGPDRGFRPRGPGRPGERRGPERSGFRSRDDGPDERREQRPSGPFTGQRGDGPAGRSEGRPPRRRPEGDAHGSFPGPGERRPPRPDGPPRNRRGPGRPEGDRREQRSGRPDGDRRGPGRPEGDRREQRSGGPGRPDGDRRGPGRPEGDRRDSGRPQGDRRGPGRPEGDRRDQRTGGPGRPGRGPGGGPGRASRPRPIVPKARQRRKPS